ncbi:MULTISPECIES: LysR family transcriptional regulator [Serratia]|uniref:LysR family transcriptional regulator n=1 Tax=Serratia TaxID=613 RepID=UPI0021793625|nr:MULTISPECIES: LysR family transcriptional regulator [Serratia]MDI6933970.1 LysR family transcriptional regulator [Serratia sp. Se-PFBMAAmG]MDI9225748.1 LysR family transcriptional regulator [Serratia bockelmannii]MDI6948611.1 LysR family transcriptional regulator [Serratia sp. Se-RSmG]MDI6972956.1 LysR family transcriptional regulator [Serratia sp. Se-RSBMAAmG]MDI9261924.1 LysR family transcriptional regulator [Serratia sp. PF2-63]
MDIKQLRALVALAEQGNYRQAASRLCISQPALSKQIQALETQLGVRLFERGRQGAVLTAGGQRLYPGAQVLVAQYQQFQQRARRVALGEAGRLSLGFGLSSFHLAPQLVAAFRQRFPEVAIGLEDLPSERQYQLLLQGELQAGFVRLPVNTPLCGVALLSDRLVLAAPGALALRADDLMARFNLLPLLQLTPKRGRGLSDQSLRFIAAHRLTPNVVQQAGDIQTLLALVAAGVGVALLPHSITHIAPAGIDILPLSGEETEWQVGIAWDPQRTDALRDNFIQTALAVQRA